MTDYTVTLDIPGVGLKVIKVNGDTCIQDAAEDAGIKLPRQCRTGACSSCAARLVSGRIDQSLQDFLSDEQIKNGFVLLCVSYPLSDCVIKTDQENACIMSDN